MKIVRVSYSTTPEYSAQNQANIQKVMTDLQAVNNPGIKYNTCLNPDGKTFVHTAFFRAEEDEKVLFALPAFKAFQEQLKASGPETPPKQELLILVGASYNIF